MASPEYEPVYVFAEWCDGPRSGLASFRGRPHLYESLWRDDENNPEDEWALVPVDPTVVAEMMERLRPAAHDANAPTLHPGWDRQHGEPFYAEWAAFKSAALAADGDAILGVGDMRSLGDQPEREDGFDPLEVCWTVRGVISIASVRERLAELERVWAGSRPSDDQLAGDELPF